MKNETVNTKQYSCKICGHLDTGLFIKLESKRYAPGNYFYLYRCKRCGGFFINHHLDYNTLQKYYPREYQPHDTKQVQTTHLRHRIMRAIRKFVYGGGSYENLRAIVPVKKLISMLFDRLAYRSIPLPRSRGKILDIGCGNGSYLAIIRELGWNGYGVESNLNAARHARITLGLNVRSGNFETVDFPEKHFDAITMWHSLEHFPEPRKIVKKIRVLLKDDGELMIGIPNFSSMDRILFKESWNGLEIPIHVCHFTPDSIQHLLEKSGFKVKKILHTTRPIDMMKSFVNFIDDRFRFKPNKQLAILLFFLSIPITVLFTIVRRSSIIKIFAN